VQFQRPEDACVQLTQQGRMHNDIANFPSTFYYSQDLRPASEWQQETWRLDCADYGNLFDRCVASQRVAVFSTEKLFRFTPSDKINETAHWPSRSCSIFNPFSLSEIKNGGVVEIEFSAGKNLRYGSYPEVFFAPEDVATKRLNEIASSYLFKDVLNFEGIKKSKRCGKVVAIAGVATGK